ncbi:MAG TPA: Hsp20/alpha crystallin family protein [Phycisphaerales bacterium]|nr:Hsp20/alpha crystallin family protein [Phycisphaerales bacterium]HMP38692.1 Hsp20/alpha crystallin family protein [Phycisphaerales bacterium]
MITRRSSFNLAPVRDFIEAFNRDVGSAVATALGSGDTEMGFPMDISEVSGELVVRANLPGFSRQDINVHLQNGVLTIEARRAEERGGDEPDPLQRLESGERYYRRERWEGSVVRRLELPTRFVDTEPKAELRDGVLTLRFPESPSSKPRQIAIG